jgi:environmental stress-induced protein Ves
VITILRAADRVAVPWKNGGGITREVVVWPPGVSLGAFDWRVSIAEVSAAGPFSRFENIDRTMAILEGRLALRFSDRNVELDANSAPLDFAGDIACGGEPLGGPVTDLNVMVRRGCAVARVERFTTEQRMSAARQIVLLATAPTTIRLDGDACALGVLDAGLIADEAFAATGTGYLIEFR